MSPCEGEKAKSAMNKATRVSLKRQSASICSILAGKVNPILFRTKIKCLPLLTLSHMSHISHER
jgi:hypothetical protein